LSVRSVPAGARAMLPPPADRPPSAPLKWFALVTLVCLYGVVVLGFLDTATGSALGCGRSFPLCDGRFFPAPTLTSIIEWTHRVASAFVGVLVAVLAVWAWLERRRSGAIRALAAVGLGFLVVESAVGALAVLAPEPDAVVAVHLGIALTSFGAVACLTMLLWQAPSSAPAAALPPGVTRYVWLALVVLYAVIYWGAYVAQTQAWSACPGWPLCRAGELIPPHATGLWLIDAIHRLAAIGILVVYAGLVRTLRAVKATRRVLYRMGHVALGLIFVMAASGAYLVLSRDSLVSTLIHVGLVTILFAVVSYMCVLTVTPAASTAQVSA